MPPTFRAAAAGVLLAGLACAAAHGAPPLIQPGAPGEGSRTLSAEESVALSRTGYVAADVTFMQHMIVHHQQAVDMVALIEGRTDDEGVSRMGRRISLTQEGEMARMRGWLEARGEPLADPDLRPGHAHGAHAAHGGHEEDGRHAGHGGHHQHHGANPDPADPYHTPLMHGMLSPAQMDALAAAEGAAFDRLFLEGMIHHHQGAIDMVTALLAEPGAGEETSLSEFLTHVVADQSAEILRMESMLSDRGADHSHEGRH